MKQTILFLLLAPLFSFAQQTTSVKIPPSKDTTVIKFVTTTTTSANTTTTYTTSSIAVKLDSIVVVTPIDNGSTGIPSNGYNTLLYSNNFDSPSSINSNQLGAGSFSSFAKTGTGSFKSVVPAGSGQISGGFRSEQQFSDSYSQTGVELAVEYDEFFETLPNVGGLSVQWHGNIQGTSGQTSLWITGGQFMVQRNVIGTAGSPNIYQSGSLMKIVKGQWYHMRWELKFSSGNDGYERLYIDGKLYYSVTGKTSDGSGQYLKVGQNLFSSPGVNSILYIDNLYIWRK